MTHSVNTANASIETLVMGAWAIFVAETKDGVLKGTDQGARVHDCALQAEGGLGAWAAPMTPGRASRPAW